MPDPNLILRRSEDRGHADHGWLKAAHTFSFAGYFDPKWVHFGPLRVLNQDVIAPGRGFGAHPHDNMEIVTWVLSGSLRHEDSMGNGAVLGPGDLQVMSAGRGLVHSEFNASAEEPCHLLQMWVFPRGKDGEPWYRDRHVAAEDRAGRLLQVVGPEGSGALESIDQDASFFVASLAEGDEVQHEVGPGRGAWLHLATGSARVNGEDLKSGDALGLREGGQLEVVAHESSELVLWELGSLP
jgi:redox-sensitive bicupin YhaK (pirin superfamily)